MSLGNPSIEYGYWSVLYGLVESLIVSGIMILVLHILLRKAGGGSLRSLLYDENGYASLSQFQFLTWTFVFLFSFLWIYFVRIQGDVLTFPPSIPIATLALMGLNTGSAVASKKISKHYKTQPQSKPGKLWNMLVEGADVSGTNSKPSLARVQLFVWTIISVMIYMAILVSMLSGPFLFGFTQTPLSGLSLPDIDPSLVTLMGLSQVGFLGTKYVTVTKNT